MTPEPPSSRRRHLLLIAAVALGLRMICCQNLECVSRDGAHFVSFAKQMAADPLHGMRVNTKQPGYALLLLAAHGLTRPWADLNEPQLWERCGQAISLAGGAIVCILVYLIAQGLFGDPRVALAAGLLAAVWPQGAHLSADLLSDMPHLALYLAALLVGWRATRTDHLAGMALCGLIAGLAYLFRQEALGVVVAVAYAAMRHSGKSIAESPEFHTSQPCPTAGLTQSASTNAGTPGRTLKRRLLGVALLSCGFVAMTAPYAVAVGEVMPNKNLLRMLFDESEEDGDLTRAALLPIGGVIPFWQAPARMLEAWGKSGRYVFSSLILIWLLLPRGPRAGRVGKRLVLAAMMLQVAAVQLRVRAFGEVSSRYMVIVAALSLPWAAAGLVSLTDVLTRRLNSSGWWKKGRSPVFAAWFIAGTLVAFVPVYYLLLPVNEGTLHLRQAGEWLLRNAQPAERVLGHDRLEQLMFYAGRNRPDRGWYKFPFDAPLDRLPDEIRRVNPAWYVDAKGTRRLAPEEDARLWRRLIGDSAPGLPRPCWVSAAPAANSAVFRLKRDK